MRTEGEAGLAAHLEIKKRRTRAEFLLRPKTRASSWFSLVASTSRVALVLRRGDVWIRAALSGPMASFPLHKYVACFELALPVSPTRIRRNKEDYDAGSAASRHSFYRFGHPLSPNGIQQRGSKEEQPGAATYVELSRPWFVSALHG